MIFWNLILLSISAQAAAPQKTLAYQNYSRGVELVSHKKWQEALSKFQSAIDLNPGYVDSYIEYARASVMLQQRKNGLDKLNAAYDLARDAKDKEKIQHEIENLSEIFFTNDTFQQYQNGLNYLRLNQVAGASNALEKALKIEPDNVLIMIAYAKSLMAEDKNKDAQEVLQKTFELNPRKSEVRLSLAEILLGKDTERSLAILKPMIANISDEKVAILQARALSSAKKNKEALQFLGERAEKQTSWVQAQFWLGKLYALEPGSGWNARKHLMTFLRRSESLPAKRGEEPALQDRLVKNYRLEAEAILTQVNQSLE